jgi:hypothetical protein
MKADMTVVLLFSGGLVLGLIVGFVFGSVQSAALDRHEQLQKSGRLRSAGAIVPGSFRRVALLLLSLVAIQLACPMLFAKDGGQWIVSAGVVLGYGGALLRQAAHRHTYR